MAAKKIEIVYDINGKAIDVAIDKTLNLQQQAKALTAELRRTKEGTDEFQVLSRTLGGVQDGLKSTSAKSQDLFGSLSMLPGPIGMIGSTMSSSIEQLKIFSSFDFKDISFQFKEVIDDVKEIGSNLGRATGITKIYDATSKLLFGTMRTLGVSMRGAAVAARALSAALVATGIGVFIALLTEVVPKLYAMATGEDEAAAATKRLNEQIDSQNRLLAANADSTKRRNAEVIAAMKAAGKTEKEIRDVQLKQSYKDYSDAYDAEAEARRTLNANLQKASKEDLKKMQDDLKAKEKATKDLYSSYKVMGLNNLATDREETKKGNKEKKETVTNQNEQLIELEKQKQAELLMLSIKGEKERAQKEIETARDKEIRDIQGLKITKDKEHLRAKAIQEVRDAAAIKITQSNTKFDTEELKQKEEALKKINELEIKAIQDETARAKVERYNQFLDEEKGLKENLDKKLITQKQYDDAVKNARMALGSDTQKIDDEAAAKANAKLIASLQEELFVMDIEQKTKLEGTTEFYDGLRAIEDKAYEIKKSKLDITQSELDAIEKEHAQNRVNITKAEQDAKRQILLQTLGLYQQFGASLQQLAGQNKGLAITGILIEKAAGIAQIIINTNAAAAKAGYFTPLGIATLVAGAAGVASSVMAANKAISEINGSGSGSSGSSAPRGDSAQNLGRNYESGGMIGGRRHAQGGTLIEAEAGEAIMTRGAVTMFAPLLSMMNQAGGGTAFSPNAMVSSYDNPRPSNDTPSTPIIKTYVVSSDMTSSQEKNARLKELSVL